MRNIARFAATAACTLHCLTAFAQSEAPPKDAPASDEPIVVLDKFVTQFQDPSGFHQQSNSIFGIEKPAIETPRSLTGVSGDMIEKFNITNMSDLGRFSPSSYSSFSFGVQSALNIRGDSADMYYGNMKKLNNANNLPTPLGPSDGVTIVRGPPSAVFGEGLVGGYINFQPKSALAETGKYLASNTGKISLTLDSWGGKIVSAEIGGPLSVLGKKAGFYVYEQTIDSDTFYIGQHVHDQTVQATFTIDLNDSLRFKTGGSFYRHSGTGIAGWNRVTQNLVDNRVYQTGMENFSLIDANKDGVASRAELYNAGLVANYNFQTNGTPFPNQVKAGTTAYTAPGGPLAFVTGLGTVKLSPRNALLERVNAGNDFVWFTELVSDKNANVIIRNNTILEHQDYHKLSDIAYFRAGITTMAEERLTMELHPKKLPGWLEISNVTSANVRYLHADNQTANVFQIFNYWDLTQFTRGYYAFANGWDSPGIAGVDSRALSKHVESGLGNVLDINIRKKLDLTVGARYDYVAARLRNFPGLATTGNVLAASKVVPFIEQSQKGSSLTSASVTYKVLPNVVPYMTYATPKSVVPGSTGGLSTGQLQTTLLTPSKLWEWGVKGDFYKGKLTVSYANYEQRRTAFNAALNNGAGDLQQTKANGNEVSITWLPLKNFSMNANLNWIELYTSPLAPTGVYTPVPVQTTGLDPIQFGGGRYQVANTPAARYEYRAAPQRQFNAFGDYIFGNSGFDLSGGISYTAAFKASNIGDIELPSALMFSADIGYRKKKWEVRLSGANLTSVLSFYPTSGGAAIIPNPTRTITLKYTYKF